MPVQIAALVIDLLIALSVILFGLARSGVPGRRSLALLALFAAAWSLCDLLLQRIPLEGLRSAIVAIVYFAACLAASAQFVYIIRQSNRQSWVSRISPYWLAVFPVLTQLLYWIPPTHDLLFSSPDSEAGAALFLTSAWGKANALYIFSLLGIGVVMLWSTFLERPRDTLMPFGLILFGSLLPPAAASLEFTGVNPLGVELLPLGFTLACCLYAAHFLLHRPNTVASVDRNAVVEGMDDGWMVLDNQNIVVDMNSAAEKLAGLTRIETLGQPITEVLGGVPNLAETLNHSQELEMKRSMRSEGGWKYLSIRSAPLRDPHGRPFGRLVLWHDVTQRRLAEDARQRARDEMLVLLNAISSAASNVVDLDEFLSDTILHIIYPFRSQVVGIFLLEDKKDKKQGQGFTLAAHLGLSAKAIEDLASVPVSSPLFASMLASRDPIQLEDVDQDGRLPSGLQGMSLACLLMLPLVAQSGENREVVGCICLGRKDKPIYTPDEIVRLTMISDQIASLIDSDRRRKLIITTTERKRVMRDLHDSVSQKLYGLVTLTEAAQAAMEAGTPIDQSDLLARIGENARQAVKEMRLFLYQMQPIDMEKDGLVSLLHHRLAAVEGRADIKAQFRSDLTDDEIALSRPTEIVLYYIAMEALNNVLKHAAAKSVSLTLKQGTRNVILEIRDDGCGFDARKVERGGLGLVNMHERTAQINGKLQISSPREGGTRVVVTVPRDPSVKPDRQTRR